MGNGVGPQEIRNRLARWILLPLVIGIARRRESIVLNSATNQLRKRNDRAQHGSPNRGR